MSTLLIRLPRFVLHDFDEADRPAFLAYQTDPRYVALYDYDASDVQRAEQLFDLFLTWRDEKPRGNFQVGIFDRRRTQLLGCAGLRKLPANSAVLGIELAPAEWGRFRLALDVAAALVEYGFAELGLDKIIGDTSSGNRRVEKLATRFGAKISARREGPSWMQKRGWHEVDWELSREAWLATTRKGFLVRR